MEVKREGFFETNSSSTHSFIIENGDSYFEEVDYKNRELIIDDTLEFGWGYETYSSYKQKVAYFLLYLEDFQAVIVRKTKEDLDKEYLKYLMEQIVEFNRRTKMFFKVVKDYTKASTIEQKFNYSPDKNLSEGKQYKGYIDHQSAYHENDWLKSYFESEETLKNALFNPNYILVIDNDNHE